MKKLFIFFIMAFLSSVVVVSAHDAWIQKKGADFHIIYGHGNKLESYDFSKIKEIRSYDLSGNYKKVTQENGIIREIKDPAMLTMFFDNGYWVQTTDGWKNFTKREALQNNLQIVVSERSLKFHKNYLKWTDNFMKPIGMKFEILPLKNPLTMKQGDILPIKVLLDGKPVENAAINTAESHEAVTKTDKNGFTEVKIKEKGFCLISAFIEQPLENDPDAEKLFLSANITFDLK